MSSLEKKFWFMLFVGIFTFGWQYSKQFLIPLRFKQLGGNCGIEETIKIKDSKILTLEQKNKISSNFWNCVQRQQTKVEEFFIEGPPTFLE